jgi:integrase
MSYGKQAKILTERQQKQVLVYLATTRNPLRNRVIFLLSIKAGLRAKEIASLKWSMATDAEGQIGESIDLTDAASKGYSGGRIPLNPALRDALIEYQVSAAYGEFVVTTQRGSCTTAQTIVNMFAVWYRDLGFSGCSSHSGRRTFVTAVAKKISSVGGSVRDVQSLARHKSLEMTRRYIEADVEAQSKVVRLI